MQKNNLEAGKLEVAPSLRLVGMTWIPIIIIYLLPQTTWGFILKAVLLLFVVIVIVGSFSSFWDRYETMGAFVTMQTVWLAGFLWIPNSLSFLRYVFVFLIILGIATKFKQIGHINKGLGADLRKNNQ